MKTNKVAFIALSLIAPVGLSLSSGGTSSAATLKTAAITAKESSNFAGYQAVDPKEPFTHITASFTVPVVKCSGAAGDSVSQYVQLVQYNFGVEAEYTAGINEFCSNGGLPGYNAFYTGSDGDNSEGGVQRPVNPGDNLVASLTSETGNRMGVYVIDLTHPGDSFNYNLAGLLSVAPAFNEVDVFSDGSADLYGPLDFDIIHFTNIEISDTANSGGFVSPDWQSYEYVLDGLTIGDQPQVNVTPYLLAANGESFENIWFAYSYH
jgi:hypothetical protein